MLRYLSFVLPALCMTGSASIHLASRVTDHSGIIARRSPYCSCWLLQFFPFQELQSINDDGCSHTRVEARRSSTIRSDDGMPKRTSPSDNRCSQASGNPHRNGDSPGEGRPPERGVSSLLALPHPFCCAHVLTMMCLRAAGSEGPRSLRECLRHRGCGQAACTCYGTSPQRL